MLVAPGKKASSVSITRRSASARAGQLVVDPEARGVRAARPPLEALAGEASVGQRALQHDTTGGDDVSQQLERELERVAVAASFEPVVVLGSHAPEARERDQRRLLRRRVRRDAPSQALDAERVLRASSPAVSVSGMAIPANQRLHQPRRTRIDAACG